MNTRQISLRLLLATTALGALATLATARPNDHQWRQTRPITTFTEAAALSPDDVVMMQCKGCKTSQVRQSPGPGSGGKTTSWLVVGSKHTCTECSGEITLIKGKTEDSMQADCSKCGDGSVSCSATMVEKN